MRRVSLEEWERRGDLLLLTGRTAHRLRNVLRVKAGSRFEATDGSSVFRLEVTRVETTLVEARITAEAGGRGESPLRVTLAQAVPRKARMDLVVQKATELGVWRIVPLLTERGVARPRLQGTARARWERIASEAVAQCGRSRQPEILPVSDLDEYLGSAQAPLRLFADPGPDSTGLESLEVGSPEAVEIVIGPEGGLTPREIEACRRASFIAVSLGPRILRSETAGIVALALVQGRWGDVG